MKTTKPDASRHSDSMLSGLSTPLLAFVALLVTLYAYGAVQKWSFLELEESTARLSWQHDFVVHLSKCEEFPSTVGICDRAIDETAQWLESFDKTPSDSFAQMNGPEFRPTQAAHLRRKALKLAERIPIHKEKEATLKVLNSWLRQIDPYSRIFAEEPKLSSEKVWSLSASQTGVANLKISNFNSAQLCQEVKETLLQLETDESIVKLRIDLRGNPGGLVESALCIGDLFVNKGEVLARFEKKTQFLPFHLKERDSAVQWLREQLDIKSIVRRSKGGMVFTKALEILVDKNSASSSEILAASLKDLGRASLIGEKTYGKGCVQLTKKLVEFKNLRAMLTTYDWYRPSGLSVEATQGIVPDRLSL